MTTRIISTVIATAIVATVPGFAQTAAELLQKGIYAQETEGKLDDAIQIYRQIVNSAPNPREIGAQAQYRLAQALLQKGDTNGAAQEFSRLARDYSEYSGVISQLARQAPGRGLFTFNPTGQPGGPFYAVVGGGRDGACDPETERCVLDRGVVQVPVASEFDPAKPISLTGKVTQIMWMNPTAWLKVESTTGGNAMTYSIKLVSPNQLVGMGMTRTTIKLGMEVTVSGILAKDGSATAQGNTITSEGTVIFDRSKLPPALAGYAQQPDGQGGGDPGPQTVFEWDPSKPISLTGKISKAEWLNPVVWLTVDTAAATYRVRLASPQYIVRAGVTRNSLTPGMEVSIAGILAKDGSMTVQATALTQGKLVVTLPAPPQ
jgi:Family of unknown function (DUF6152)/Tetratricopeptide repeat